MRASGPAILFALLLPACGGATLVAPAGEELTTSERPPPPRYAIALRLEEAGETPDGTPHTRVSLVRITPEGVRTVEDLATEIGACYHHELPGALIAARCWWAGTGAEYVVSRVADAVVASRAQADEDAGLGALSEVARLDVPENVELDVLGPGASGR